MTISHEAIAQALANKTTPKLREAARELLPMVLDGALTEKGLAGTVLDDRVYPASVDVVNQRLYAECQCRASYSGTCVHAVALMAKYVETPDFFRFDVDDEDAPMPHWRRVPWSTWRHIEMRRHTNGLEILRIADLRQIARGHGWTVKGTRKADVTLALAREFDVPEHGRQVYDALSSEEKLALAVLFWGEGQVDLSDEKELSTLASLFGLPAEAGEHVETTADALDRHGIITHATSRKRVWPLHVIARSVMRWLPPLLEGIVPTHDRLDSGQRLDVRLSDPGACARAVGLVLHLIAQRNLSLKPTPIGQGGHDSGITPELRYESSVREPYQVRLSTTWMPESTTRYLAPIMGTTQFELAIEALIELQVLAFREDQYVANASHVMALASEDELAQRAILARIFFDRGSLSLYRAMLRHDEGLSVWFSTGWEEAIARMVNDTTSLCGLMLRVLCTLPEGQWVYMEDLEPILRALWPRFCGSMAQQPWYSRKETWEIRATPKRRVDDWSRAEGGYIRHLIVDALHWLGLVDVALGRNGELVALRPQGLADLYLDRAEMPAPPNPSAPPNEADTRSAVRIDLPRITISPMRLNGQALHLLGSMGQMGGASLDALTYVVDPTACYRAFENGTTLDDLVASWERMMPVAMPPALRRQLAEWWEKYGEVRIYADLTVIEFADDYALAEMRAVTSIDRALIAEVSPRLVIIAPDAVPDLVAELEQAGYAPKQV